MTQLHRYGTFGAMTLRDWLKKQGMTPTAFARLMGVSHSTVLRYLSGDRIPEKDVMERIARETGGAVTPNDFFDLAPALPDADSAAGEAL